MRKNKIVIFLILFTLITVIPCSLSSDNNNALRLSGFLAIGTFFIANGFWFIYLRLKNKNFQNVVYAIAIISIPIFFIFSLTSFKNNLEYANFGEQNNIANMSQKLKPYYQSADSIYIENKGNQPYIYILSFCGIKPADFQNCIKISDTIGMWKYIITFDKCRFVDVSTLLPPPAYYKGKEILVSSNLIQGFTPFDSLISNDHIYYYSRPNIYK